MVVYGKSVKDTLYIGCGGECRDLQVQCPSNYSIPSRLNTGQCIIDCSNPKDDEDMCETMEIYAEYGIPKTVQFSR